MSWGTEVRFVCIAAVLGLAGLSGEGIPVAGREEEVLLVKAGDLAECADTGDKVTAELLDSLSGTVFNVGEDGYEFGGCSGPDRGRDEARTDPVPGNREYANSVSGTGGTLARGHAKAITATISATGTSSPWIARVQRSESATRTHPCCGG